MRWKVSRQMRAPLARLGHHGADPLGPVAGHELELSCPFVAQGVEELPDDRLGPALGGPDHPAGHVVTHDREIALALLVLHLVDGDGDEAVEEVDTSERFGGDADTHVVDRPPADPVAAGRGQLGRDDGVEDHQVLEGPGEPAVVAGPGNLRHSHSVLGAAHPGGGGHQLAGGEARVDVAPSALPAPVVEPGGGDPALAAAAPGAHLGSDPDVEAVPASLASLDKLATHDHHGRDTQPQQLSQYA